MSSEANDSDDDYDDDNDDSSFEVEKKPVKSTSSSSGRSPLRRNSRPSAAKPVKATMASKQPAVVARQKAALSKSSDSGSSDHDDNDDDYDDEDDDNGSGETKNRRRPTNKQTPRNKAAQTRKPGKGITIASKSLPDMTTADSPILSRSSTTTAAAKKQELQTKPSASSSKTSPKKSAARSASIPLSLEDCDAYDIVLPPNLLNSKSLASGECTILVQIDPSTAPNGDNGTGDTPVAPVLDLTGAVGAVGRLEVDGTAQRVILDLKGTQYTGRTFPGPTALLVSVAAPVGANSSKAGHENPYLKVDGITDEFCSVTAIGNSLSRMKATVQKSKPARATATSNDDDDSDFFYDDEDVNRTTNQRSNVDENNDDATVKVKAGGSSTKLPKGSQRKRPAAAKPPSRSGSHAKRSKKVKP